jgi:ATP-dependent protease Clp ATPase subunit
MWNVAGSDAGRHHLQFDVTRLLFICGGVFDGLDEVCARLGRHPEQPVTSDILKVLGVIPDLVRRLQSVMKVVPLDEETLVRIVSFVDLDRMASEGAELPPADRPRD